MNFSASEYFDNVGLLEGPLSVAGFRGSLGPVLCCVDSRLIHDAPSPSGLMS